MARPTKYTPEIEQRIVEALLGGVSRRGAAEYVGIDEATFLRWLHRHPDFATAVRAAEARVEVSATVAIRTAWADGDWRAAVEWLKRRRPAEWGDSQRVELRATIQQLAREHGLTPEEEREAVREAERVLRELQRRPI